MVNGPSLLKVGVEWYSKGSRGFSGGSQPGRAESPLHFLPGILMQPVCVELICRTQSLDLEESERQHACL